MIAFIYNCYLRSPGCGHHDARAAVESIGGALFTAGDGVVPSGCSRVSSGLICCIRGGVGAILGGGVSDLSGRVILSASLSISLGGSIRIVLRIRTCVILGGSIGVILSF